MKLLQIAIWVHIELFLGWQIISILKIWFLHYVSFIYRHFAIFLGYNVWNIVISVPCAHLRHIFSIFLYIQNFNKFSFRIWFYVSYIFNILLYKRQLFLNESACFSIFRTFTVCVRLIWLFRVIGLQTLNVHNGIQVLIISVKLWIKGQIW